MDIIGVMAIIILSLIAGAVIALLITRIMERSRARRNNLQPLLGVVLPKEDNDA